VRVLLVDNYDSFAWNLVQALAALGADAVVVSPGPCTPAEAGISVELVRAAARRGVPLLGVCLGHQAIGAAFGGRVVRARAPVHGKTSEVLHDGRGVLRGLPSPFTAMRYHSLVVEEPLPDGIEATARTASGELMGLRHARLPIEGVQFHPESFMTAAGPALLANFLEGARAANLGRA
jgi:anthranilate synthase/aminodeoxychorismate synthase-like glutamine amidotransferase